MITKNQYDALVALDKLDLDERISLRVDNLVAPNFTVTDAGRQAEQRARSGYAEPPTTTDMGHYRVFKAVSVLRRINSRLSWDQALEVVLAARDQTRDDRLREVEARIINVLALVRESNQAIEKVLAKVTNSP